MKPALGESLSIRFDRLAARLPLSAYEFYQNCVPDFGFFRLNPVEALVRKVRNRNLSYRDLSYEEMLKNKKSDTLFILGCNQSVNEIPVEIWKRLENYDTFGMNYWLYHSFVPTYYTLEYGHDPRVDPYHIQLIRRNAERYGQTVFFVSSRARRRGQTPRMMPEFFPPTPKVFYFLYPKTVNCPPARPFETKDFRESIFYRGTLNMCLHLGRFLKFKRIVLIGCEMDQDIPFYEHNPEAQWINKVEGYQRPRAQRQNTPYREENVKKEKHSLSATLLAINELVLKPEGIELCVFNQRSLLYPRLRLFEF